MILDRVDKEGKVHQSSLSYWQMQTLRQQNILAAVQDETASVERLVHMYGIAQKGLRLAFRYGATESDALTFIYLQGDIRDRLHEAPTHEVTQALAQMALSDEIAQAG